MKHIVNAALVGIIGLALGFAMGEFGAVCVTGWAIDDDGHITDKRWIKFCQAFSDYISN